MIASIRRRRLRTVAVTGAAALVGTLVPGTPVAGATTELDEVAQFSIPQQAFHSSYNNESMSSVAYGDVTGDGQADLIVGGMDGYVTVTTMTGTVQGRFLSGPGAIHSSPTLADLNGDGVDDIVVGNTHGDVVAFTGNGTELFRKRTNLENERLGVTDKPDDIYSTPAVGDLDGDGAPEIVVTSADHHVYAWNPDGSLLPGFPSWQKDTTWASPALADVDDDGFAEIVIAFDIDYLTAPHVGCDTFGASVRVLEHDATEKWHTCIPGEIIMSSPAVADLDADGDLEITIGSGIFFGWEHGFAPSRKLWVLDAGTGAVVPGWPVDLGAVSDINPSVGDLDGDAQLEIATTAADGYVSVFEPNGQLKWKECALDEYLPCPYTGAVNGLDAPVSIADVDNDGANEVVAFMRLDVVVYHGATGAEETRHRIASRFTPNAQPTIVSHGGDATIIVQALNDDSGNGQPSAGDTMELTVLSTGTPLGDAPWPMARQNPTRTGSTETTWDGGAWMDPWLSAVYVDLLGRPIDPSGLAYWKGRLAGGLTKADLAHQFAASDEWLGVVVDDLYWSILDRGPDAGGRAFWISELRQGRPTANVVASFFSSDEYFESVGGTNPLFIDALYDAVLDRGPDAGGREFWVDRLDAGTPRGLLSTQVFSSVESGGRRVDGLYDKLLRRSPDAGGRAFWAEYLTTGDEIALTALLIDSPEYLDRAEDRFEE